MGISQENCIIKLAEGIMKCKCAILFMDKEGQKTYYQNWDQTKP